MSDNGTPNPMVALAFERPPRSFSAFRLTPVPPEPGPNLTPFAHFELACKGCGADAFHVGSFPRRSSEPDAGPDDLLYRPPHRLMCGSCRKIETLFDARRDGYDGHLNGGCPYESGDTDEKFSRHTMKVTALATYNIDKGELEDLARGAGAGVQPTDLFDWFNLIAITTDSGERVELDYECA